MISDTDLPLQPDSLQQQPPLMNKKNNLIWIARIMPLLIVNVLFVSWANDQLSLVGRLDLYLILVFPLVALLLAIIDFIAVFFYIRKLSNGIITKVIIYTVFTVFITVNLELFYDDLKVIDYFGLWIFIDPVLAPFENPILRIVFAITLALLIVRFLRPVHGWMREWRIPALLAITVLIFLVVTSWGQGTRHTPCPPPEGTSVSREPTPQAQAQDNKVQLIRFFPGSSAGTVVPPSSPRLIHRGKTVPGQVTVELTKPSFRRGECVQVRVANGLDQPVYNYYQAACSIAILERRDIFGWREAISCYVREPWKAKIVPGEVVEVALDPYSARLLTSHQLKYGPPAFGMGIYRIAFSYTTLSERTTVTSPAFVVTP